MDILLGLCLLTSLVSLEYGSMTGERPPLALFLILSLATMAVFWLWFLYLKYAKMESEAAKEVRKGTLLECVINKIRARNKFFPIHHQTIAKHF